MGDIRLVSEDHCFKFVSLVYGNSSNNFMMCPKEFYVPLHFE
jgi:hypothetical protein